MVRDPWTQLQMEVADLHFDVTVAEIKRVSEKARSITGFCSEDENAERNWDLMMQELNKHHHELFLSHILPL